MNQILIKFTFIQNMLINKKESTYVKYLNDAETFIEQSNDMDGIQKNIEECNRNTKHRIFLAFNDMVAHMFSNKNIMEQ